MINVTAERRYALVCVSFVVYSSEGSCRYCPFLRSVFACFGSFFPSRLQSYDDRFPSKWLTFIDLPPSFRVLGGTMIFDS
jgi:hypothetical protein